jgi:hypothetical protein
VRRWISDVSGNVRITGRVARGADGDGVQAVIMVDGEETFAAEVGGAEGPTALDYDVVAVVEKGSLVDFILTPGPGVDVNFDATIFTAIIQPL